MPIDSVALSQGLTELRELAAAKLAADPVGPQNADRV